MVTQRSECSVVRIAFYSIRVRKTLSQESPSLCLVEKHGLMSRVSPWLFSVYPAPSSSCFHHPEHIAKAKKDVSSAR